MKRSQRNKICVSVCFCLSVFSGPAQEVFTYTSFLNSVRQNNPLSKRSENAAEYGNYQRRAANGNYDPQLSSSGVGKQFNGYNYFTNVNAELKQPIYTSHYLKAGYQYGQGTYLNPENSTPGIGLPYLGLEASLLQGMFFDKRRADLQKAKHYSDYYNAEQKIQMNDLLYTASTAYVEALYAKKINQLYGYFTDLASQRFNGIRELSQVGERPAVDTVEAAILLQGRMLDKQSGEMEIVKKMNDLLILNASGTALSALNVAIADSLEQLYSQTAKTIQNALSNEAVTNPIVSQYFAKQGILETEKRFKREMIKPVLNLSYNFLNTSNTIMQPVINTSNYKWGASFSFPLFLRKPRNEYKMASLDAQNNSLELLNKQNQLKFKRQYILEAIRIVQGQIRNAEKSSLYSKLLLEAERLKFLNGESSLFLLNSRENKWLESELKLAEYRMKMIKNLIELIYVNGDLAYDFTP